MPYLSAAAMFTQRTEVLVDDVVYAITTVAANEGCYTFWYCPLCERPGTANRLQQGIDESIAMAEANVRDHHRMFHPPP
jgi:hypothetical protein